MNLVKKKLTLQDVANACGVSPTAVSLVLNNKASNVSLATREKIIKTAQEMNFHVNGIARSLAMNKTHTIGIIVPDISNAFFSESIRHIQIELNKFGYEVFLCNSEEKHDNDIKYLKLLSSRQVDGIIMTMSSESMADGKWQHLHSFLNNLEVPHILYDRYYPGEDARVCVDNGHSAYELMKHFIKNGHTKIGLITGPMSLNSSKERYRGAKQALEEANIPLLQDQVFNGKYDIETGRLGAEKLLGKVTAIFAFNDLQAYGVLEKAKENNISIPKDLSLIGFDDIFYSSILDVKLTTVKQPLIEMSKEICKLLIDMIEQNGQKQQISLPGTFIVRDSVGKAKNE